MRLDPLDGSLRSLLVNPSPATMTLYRLPREPKKFGVGARPRRA